MYSLNAALIYVKLFIRIGIFAPGKFSAAQKLSANQNAQVSRKNAKTLRRRLK